MASQIHPDIRDRGLHENLPFRRRIYPTIDPTSEWASQSLKDKAVFITGASRGIGRSTAIMFAKAGAAVAISARSDRALDETKALILSEVPDARVESYVVDVTKGAEMEVAVNGAATAFGSLDVVIANAGYCNSFDTPMDQRPANEWWRTFEVNVLGVYNTVRSATKHLGEAKGYFIAVSSIGAQGRWPGGSDYQTSKHAVNRLVEFIAQGNLAPLTTSPTVGGVVTEVGEASKLMEQGVPFPDPPELAASTMLYLCSGKVDWLNGRYIDANWDLGQVEREWKDKILEKDLLVNKLDVVA
ncbi:NAD-P-binding protein [Peniophora sp. CONT]|nr:NAD-P-binding protein [Peniophora sp. CONT]